MSDLSGYNVFCAWSSASSPSHHHQLCCPEQGSQDSPWTALTASPKHKENRVTALRSWEKMQDPESNKNAATWTHTSLLNSHYFFWQRQYKKKNRKGLLQALNVGWHSMLTYCCTSFIELPPKLYWNNIKVAKTKQQSWQHQHAILIYTFGMSITIKPSLTQSYFFSVGLPSNAQLLNIAFFFPYKTSTPNGTHYFLSTHHANPKWIQNYQTPLDHVSSSLIRVPGC